VNPARDVAALPDARVASLEPSVEALDAAFRAALTAWLETADPAARFTAKDFKAIVRRMGPAFAQMSALRDPIVASLVDGADVAAALAAKHLDHEVAAIADMPVKVDAAAVTAATRKALAKQFRANTVTSLAGMADEIRQVFATATADKLTVAELVDRLEALDPAASEQLANPWLNRIKAAVVGIARGLVARAKSWVRRLVTTETIDTYDQQHAAAVEQVQETVPDLIRRWDATMDSRVCPVCAGLNGKTAALDETFDGGFFGPPSHPGCRCRCSVVRSQ
jgi:SPP1 gp7 family putative phage head morphogenesis protein